MAEIARPNAVDDQPIFIELTLPLVDSALKLVAALRQIGDSLFVALHAALSGLAGIVSYRLKLISDAAPHFAFLQFVLCRLISIRFWPVSVTAILLWLTPQTRAETHSKSSD